MCCWVLLRRVRLRLCHPQVPPSDASWAALNNLSVSKQELSVSISRDDCSLSWGTQSALSTYFRVVPNPWDSHTHTRTISPYVYITWRQRMHGNYYLLDPLRSWWYKWQWTTHQINFSSGVIPWPTTVVACIDILMQSYNRSFSNLYNGLHHCLFGFNYSILVLNPLMKPLPSASARLEFRRCICKYQV